MRCHLLLLSIPLWIAFTLPWNRSTLNCSKLPQLPTRAPQPMSMELACWSRTSQQLSQLVRLLKQATTLWKLLPILGAIPRQTTECGTRCRRTLLCRFTTTITLWFKLEINLLIVLVCLPHQSKLSKVKPCLMCLFQAANRTLETFAGSSLWLGTPRANLTSHLILLCSMCTHLLFYHTSTRWDWLPLCFFSDYH